MSNPKKSRNKEDTIKNIYDCFFNLVLEIGYHKASTNKIAKAANISVGTLYHHFPEGKKEIMRKYFENVVETSIELEEFRKFDLSNPSLLFKGFVTNVLKNHKEKKAYNIAFRSAILSDNELAEAHKKRVFEVSKGIIENLLETSLAFKNIPKERLIRAFVFIYNITNAIIYQHLAFMDLFEKDEDLIAYLTFILTQTIGYLQKE